MKLAFLPILLCPFFSIAQLEVAEVFSDNMILQRNKPIRIWGKSTPGSSVTVMFSKVKRIAIVNNDSVWMVSYPKQKETLNPQTLSVTSRDGQVVVKNILVGDIWICTGQSNMEWPMVKEQHWKDEKHNAKQSNIRLLNPSPAGRNVFGVPYTDSLIKRLTKERFYDWNGWQECDSSSVKLMSAVAYYFAKKVMEETGVPIGIINLSIGGAPLESFIDKEVLKKSKQFAGKVNGDWLDNTTLPVWIRQRGRQNVGTLQNAPTDENGKYHAYKPGVAYEGGIQPLHSMPIKGILCYQGESNAQETERVKEYAVLSKLMIDHYRKKWKQPNLPFYFVQLSSIDTIKYKGQLWPEFRDEQRKMLDLIPNSGMVVCSDIGEKDDVHPANKKDVGERLARWALNKAYEKNIIPSGPLPITAKYHAGKLTVSFRYSGNALRTSDGKPLKGFSLDGKKEAQAFLGDRVIFILTTQKPKYVYYGWTPFSNGNLINSADLPASTFKIKVQ